ncbi:MAG: hypothetical protein HW380_237 [Magnetococcales bacterium]|nr:hypothetical protein [Magnetococcales bacterium]
MPEPQLPIPHGDEGPDAGERDIPPLMTPPVDNILRTLSCPQCGQVFTGGTDMACSCSNFV